MISFRAVFAVCSLVEQRFCRYMLVGVTLAALSACSDPSSGSVTVLMPCQTTAQCSGSPCTNGYCDFTNFDAGTAPGDSAAAVTDATADVLADGKPGGGDGGKVDATVAKTDVATAKPDVVTVEPDGATAIPDGTTTKPDVATAKPDTVKPDTAKPDTSPPIDAGCKTAAGKTCCTDDASCATGSACAIGGCNTTTGECVVTVKANCCAKDSDCGASNDPCRKASCDVASKVCSFVDAANGDPCDDGVACTQKDNCVVGKCSGQPLDCDDGDACTTDSCNNGKCSNVDKASCCVSGTCCDVAAQTLRSKGVRCDTKLIIDNRCRPNGLAVEARYGFRRCDGNGSDCPTTVMKGEWSSWFNTKTCATTAKCVQTGSSFDCKQTVTAFNCKSGVCCDTKQGKIKSEGAQCSTAGYSSQEICVGNTVFRGTSYRGCWGTSTTGCSSSLSRRYWAPAVFNRACPVGETCYASGSKAYCTTTTKCSSGACCDVPGNDAPLPKWTQCASAASTTATKCVGGNQIFERKAYNGCTGQASTCSTLSQYYAYGDWTAVKTCAAGQGCGFKDGKPTCGVFYAPEQCSSGSCCDVSRRRFKPIGTQCSAGVKKSVRYKCAADYKSILIQRAYDGCTGKGTDCLSQSDHYYWAPWQTYSACSSGSACKQSSSTTSKPYCSKTKYTCTSGTCCNLTKKTFKPRYSSCTTVTKSTVYKCSPSGQKVWVRKATFGCRGYGSKCLTSKSYPSWSDWKDDKVCSAGTACVQTSSSGASCASNGN